MAENKKDLILDIKDLVIHYETDDGTVEAVNGLADKLSPWLSATISSSSDLLDISIPSTLTI